MAKKRQAIRVTVTERALYQRINRKLKQDRSQLRTARSERAEQDLGRHYIVDTRRNAVRDTRVDLETLGRKLGVLQPWEALER